MMRHPIRASLAGLLVAAAACAPALAQPEPSTPRLRRPPAAPAKPQRPPVFDTALNAKLAIDEAAARATPDRKRVLVVWGDNDNPWSYRLQDAFKNPDTAPILAREYEIVWIDVAAPSSGQINAAIARALGADVSAGTPLLSVLDLDGKAVAHQPASKLEDPKPIKGRPSYRPTSLQDFLLTHVAERQDAHGELDAARARAKESSKAVFIRFVETPDSFAARLDALLRSAEAAPVIDRHFVSLRVDLPRSVDGPQLLEELAGPTLDHLPWYAFLNADGKTLVTSQSRTDTNIGFPTGEEEIAAFVGLFRAAAPAMTDTEAEAIRKAAEAAQVRP